MARTVVVNFSLDNDHSLDDFPVSIYSGLTRGGTTNLVYTQIVQADMPLLLTFEDSDLNVNTDPNTHFHPHCYIKITSTGCYEQIIKLEVPRVDCELCVNFQEILPPTPTPTFTITPTFTPTAPTPTPTYTPTYTPTFTPTPTPEEPTPTPTPEEPTPTPTYTPTFTPTPTPEETPTPTPEQPTPTPTPTFTPTPEAFLIAAVKTLREIDDCSSDNTTAFSGLFALSNNDTIFTEVGGKLKINNNASGLDLATERPIFDSLNNQYDSRTVSSSQTTINPLDNFTTIVQSDSLADPSGPSLFATINTNGITTVYFTVCPEITPTPTPTPTPPKEPTTSGTFYRITDCITGDDYHLPKDVFCNNGSLSIGSFSFNVTDVVQYVIESNGGCGAETYCGQVVDVNFSAPEGSETGYISRTIAVPQCGDSIHCPQ